MAAVAAWIEKHIRALFVVACLVAIGAVSSLFILARHTDAPQTNGKALAANSSTPSLEKTADQTGAAAPAPVPETATPSSPPQASPAPLKFAAQLQNAGARACLPRIEQLGAGSAGGVNTLGVASNWFVGAPDTRAVSVFVGQNYGDKAAIPYGATEIFATPVAPGQCDGFSVQVVPSPLSCAALKQSILTRGKALDDLAGVPLLQDANGQIMLVPTAANTCVLVATKLAYTP